jgi:hypothetical protein
MNVNSLEATFTRKNKVALPNNDVIEPALMP